MRAAETKKLSLSSGGEQTGTGGQGLLEGLTATITGGSARTEAEEGKEQPAIGQGIGQGGEGTIKEVEDIDREIPGSIL